MAPYAMAFAHDQVTGPDACVPCRGRGWRGFPARPPVTSGPLRDPYGGGADEYDVCSACDGSGRRGGERDSSVVDRVEASPEVVDEGPRASRGRRAAGRTGESVS